MIDKKGGDKGKTPMDPGPFTVSVTDQSNTTSNERELTPNRHLLTGATLVRPPHGVENVDRGRKHSKSDREEITTKGKGNVTFSFVDWTDHYLLVNKP